MPSSVYISRLTCLLQNHRFAIVGANRWASPTLVWLHCTGACVCLLCLDWPLTVRHLCTCASYFAPLRHALVQKGQDMNHEQSTSSIATARMETTHQLIYSVSRAVEVTRLSLLPDSQFLSLDPDLLWLPVAHIKKGVPNFQDAGTVIEIPACLKSRITENLTCLKSGIIETLTCLKSGIMENLKVWDDVDWIMRMNRIDECSSCFRFTDGLLKSSSFKYSSKCSLHAHHVSSLHTPVLEVWSLGLEGK